uniref:PGG domain-containing protein n=1 Tax=Oryza rufipogon TaxID=4529 RepID=A0A0E0R7Q2_ORYRU
MVSLPLQWKPALATHVDRNKSSPLHFASSDGDCSIWKPALATHVDRNKSSPLHFASSDGDCSIDNEGFSPIHAAALMGHTATVRLLLQFSPASADICDNRGQSFVHTAATKGHSSIISYAIGSSMLEHLLNAQDREGNTPLHLAVDAGKCKIVSKLLSSEIVQAHIMNNEGHTPSDLVQNCKGFYSMVSLVVKMYASGAQFQPQRQDHIEKWNAQDIMKWRDTTSKYLAIVSTLVATVAFSAAFNIPGSYGDDGKANLAGNYMYDTFLILDTISLVTSVVAIMLLVFGRAFSSHHSWLSFMISTHFLWLSINTMVLGFLAAISAVMSKKKGLNITMAILIYFGMWILTMLLTSLTTVGSFTGILKFLFGGRMERQRRAKRRISRQYPYAIFYTFNMVLFFVIANIALAGFDTFKSLSY